MLADARIIFAKTNGVKLDTFMQIKMAVNPVSSKTSPPRQLTSVCRLIITLKNRSSDRKRR